MGTSGKRIATPIIDSSIPVARFILYLLLIYWGEVHSSRHTFWIGLQLLYMLYQSIRILLYLRKWLTYPSGTNPPEEQASARAISKATSCCRTGWRCLQRMQPSSLARMLRHRNQSRRYFCSTSQLFRSLLITGVGMSLLTAVQATNSMPANFSSVLTCPSPLLVWSGSHPFTFHNGICLSPYIQLRANHTCAPMCILSISPHPLLHTSCHRGSCDNFCSLQWRPPCTAAQQPPLPLMRTCTTVQPPPLAALPPPQHLPRHSQANTRPPAHHCTPCLSFRAPCTLRHSLRVFLHLISSAAYYSNPMFPLFSQWLITFHVHAIACAL